MEKAKIIELKETILDDNDADAAALRQELRARRTCLINLMSAPGSGKTSTLLALRPYFQNKLRWGVMEADIDSDVDANRLLRAGIPAVQLHTGGMCHLDADMTRQGIRALCASEQHNHSSCAGGQDDMFSAGENSAFTASAEIDLIVLENIGNLVCPAEFDTGAQINMTILSVPEGDDKPAKYPLMYQVCDILVINKTDTLPAFDFRKSFVEECARRQNPDVQIFYISARTGEGVEELAAHLLRRIRQENQR